MSLRRSLIWINILSVFQLIVSVVVLLLYKRVYNASDYNSPLVRYATSYINYKLDIIVAVASHTPYHKWTFLFIPFNNPVLANEADFHIPNYDSLRYQCVISPNSTMPIAYTPIYAISDIPVNTLLDVMTPNVRRHVIKTKDGYAIRFNTNK